MSESPRLKPGDKVLHRPSGETWVVGAVYGDGTFIPLGWPCASERVDDCELVKSASAEDSRRWLLEMAQTPNDPRGAWARARLAKEAKG